MAALRLFVAAPLSPALEEGVGELLTKVSKGRGVRWVVKAQLHITLRFIGAFEELRLPKLEQCLKEVSKTITPFEAQIGGLNAFPGLDRPRVLFIPILRGEDGFKGVEKALTPALEKIGIKADEKEYHPHLTLGRVRENENPGVAVQNLRKICPAHWESWKVDRFVLFNSQLAASGSVYTKIEEFVFGEG